LKAKKEDAEHLLLNRPKLLGDVTDFLIEAQNLTYQLILKKWLQTVGEKNYLRGS
jgi:hypothetical protein